MKTNIDKSSVKDIIELNDIQKGILFHYLENTQSNNYNVQLLFEIVGEIDIEKFKKSITILQGNHEVLRSIFRWEKISKPLQIILKTYPLNFVYIDISGRDGNENINFLDKVIKKDREKRFDLTELPIRIKIIKVSEELYKLSITYHHILIDGWSNGIFLKELLYCYKSLLAGTTPILNKKLSCKEVQKKISDNVSIEGGDQYWKDYLFNYNITLPFNKNQSLNNSPQKVSANYPIEHLESYARKNNITIASLVYTAYGILLQKKTNTPDIVFGTTLANRDPRISGIEEVIGNFINTIPLRVTSHKGQSLKEIALDLQAKIIDRNEFSHIPYYSIKKTLGLKPNEDLFDSIMVIENYPIDKDIVKDINNFEIDLKYVYENINIPLVLTVFIQNELRIEFTYNENSFETSYIEILADHLINIISSLVNNPDESIDTFSFFSSGEKHQILNDFNNTSKAIPEKKTLVDLFEEQVKRTPDNYAIVDKVFKISFDDLNIKSNQLAHELLKRGVKNEDVVGIMTTRRIEMLVSILAVLKVGGAYLPIDPEYPISRISYMVEDSNVKLLLTETLLRSVYDQLSTDINCLNVLSEEIYSLHDKEDLNIKFEPNNLAYLIYTSGSTGRPKGIMIEHLNVINYIHGVLERIELDKISSILCLTTISFDIFVTETLLPLLNGLKIVIANSTAQKDPDVLSYLIQQHEVDCLQLTPSHLRLLLMGGDDSFFKGIRLIMIGGEPLPFELLNELRERYKGKIYNMYGPTETTVWSTIQDLTNAGSIDIGKPICNTSIYILDIYNNLQPVGIPGELCIGGLGLARGYWKNEKLTQEKFIDNPYQSNDKIYKTGDLAYWLPDGNIKIMGRMDNQVKIRGFRIELGEIESQLVKFDQIRESVVEVKEIQNDKVLVAYYVSEREIEVSELKKHLAEKLPDYMVPSYLMELNTIPLTPNGKVNRKALPDPEIELDIEYVAPTNKIEEKLVTIWSELLGHKNISINGNYFDIGADSLKLINASNRIKQEFNKEININDLFTYPTIYSLAKYIKNGNEINNNNTEGFKEKEFLKKDSLSTSNDIAVIGMAGRFPNAANVDMFWEKLKTGKDLITRKEKDKNSSIVHAKGHLEDYDNFDNLFFNYTPSEVESMDPQVRIFHECVYEALENSAYNPYKYSGYIGLYAGASLNPYYNINNADIRREDWIEKWDQASYLYKDFLCPRISYKLNLKGPSVTINTACSTSLVAVDKACTDVLADKTDIAIAGGISITFHDNNGYYYHKDMILSPDGKCKAFDEKSAGTVSGNGVGVVVLKRLDRALNDGDNIHAIIKGTAINNDGNDKVGFTAPSINGQSEVIKSAIKNAGIQNDTITYIESHGTGTKLGDPIEIAALTKAFNTGKKQFCAIGSVKTNIGHLDAAAGIAGLIKTILALKHKQIPPSLYFDKPNPNIDFANSPFYVNNKLVDWKNQEFPRRAGISSFGIGGTNAHVIIEEAPIQEKSSGSREYQILLLSARTQTSLHKNIFNLKKYLLEKSDSNLADVAYTLKEGREYFEYRKMFVCKNKEDAIEQLNIENLKEIKPTNEHNKQIVFMFPGQGSQYINMGYDLYNSEPYFKEIVDECFEIFYNITGSSLKPIIFPDKKYSESSSEIDEIYNTHPSLFIIEYALAKLLMKWGIYPDYMIGHSIGEYVAACISGVFTLKEALQLVIKRSLLIHKAKEGKMLGISVTEKDINELLKNNHKISLSVVNSSELCVVSGEEDAINKLQKELIKKGYQCGLIQTFRASHSHMMEEILSEFEKEIDNINIKPQKIPFVSNVTGDLANDNDIAKTRYWVNHLRQTVKFSNGVETICKNGRSIFIEVGPGNVLGSFIRSNKNIGRDHNVVFTVRHKQREDHDLKQLLSGLGKLWINRIEPNWDGFYENEKRRKVAIPTYSFDKIKYPVQIDFSKMLSNPMTGNMMVENQNFEEWFHVPSWELSESLLNPRSTEEETCYLVMLDHYGIGHELYRTLRKEGKLVRLRQGKTYCEKDDNLFEINPGNEEDIIKLFSKIGSWKSYKIINAWGISDNKDETITIESVKSNLNTYFYGLLNIAKVIGNKTTSDIEIFSITDSAHYVLHGDIIKPEKSTILGALKVIQKEYNNISCRNIDIELPQKLDTDFVKILLKEIESDSKQSTIAYRRNTRFIEVSKPVKLNVKNNEAIPFSNEGVYLITGGTGGLGLSFAKRIARDVKGVKLLLIGRKELPEKEHWKVWLSAPEHKENELYKTVEELQTIENEGGIVYYRSVDITDEDKLKTILLKLEEEIGKVTGVIHAAGIADYAGIIYNRTKEENEKVFSSKIYGTIILDKLLAKNKLEFFVLCSSISAALPIEGQVGYVAANMFLNSYSRFISIRNKNNPISIGWNTWRDVGFAAKFHETEHDHVFYNSISPEEGYNALVRIIQNRLPEIIISKFCISDLVEKSGFLSEINKKSDYKLDSKQEDATEYSTTSAKDIIHDLWQKCLGLPEISSDDDFFEIGGNSLKALTLIGRIQKTFNIDISIKDFFNNSSISSLTEHIEFLKDNNEGNTLFQIIPKAELRDYYPITEPQKAMLILNQMAPHSKNYNLTNIIELDSKAELSLVQNIINKLIERHEIFRTSFKLIDQDYIQTVEKKIEIKVKSVELEEDQIISFLKKFIQPFDVAVAPLFRICLVNIKNSNPFVLIDFHHIIIDGFSVQLFKREFISLYRGNRLANLQYQFTDYIQWNKKRLNPMECGKQNKFWLNQFKDYSHNPIFKESMVSILENSGRLFSFKINGKEKNEIDSIVKKTGITKYTFFLTAYALFINKCTYHSNIVIGTPFANRKNQEEEQLIGMFVNILPVLLQINSSLKLTEFLKLVQNKIMEISSNSELPLGSIQRELKENNIIKTADSVVQTVFSLQNQFEKDYYKESELNKLIHSHVLNIPKYPITLDAVETKDDIVFWFLSTEEAEKLIPVDKFKGFISEIIKNLENSINEIEPEPTKVRVSSKINNEKEEGFCFS